MHAPALAGLACEPGAAYRWPKLCIPCREGYLRRGGECSFAQSSEATASIVLRGCYDCAPEHQPSTYVGRFLDKGRFPPPGRSLGPWYFPYGQWLNVSKHIQLQLTGRRRIGRDFPWPQDLGYQRSLALLAPWSQNCYHVQPCSHAGVGINIRCHAIWTCARAVVCHSAQFRMGPWCS